MDAWQRDINEKWYYDHRAHGMRPGLHTQDHKSCDCVLHDSKKTLRGAQWRCWPEQTLLKPKWFAYPVKASSYGAVISHQVRESKLIN